VFFTGRRLKKKLMSGVFDGFVRNERNGDVYLEAEAPEEILYKFIKWCNLGPSQAVVEKMDAKPGAIVGFTDFEISPS
jgi:acylphosphatase